MRIASPVSFRPLKFLLRSDIALRIRQFLRTTHRSYVFRRGLRNFMNEPHSCTTPGNATIDDLIYGWGNESWSAQGEYLASCIGHALKTNGPILECGSGLSTILIGAIARMRGLSYWVLEDSKEWAKRTQKYLNRYEIGCVNLCVTPLVNFGEFSWYNAPLETMPKNFALVICDGPPGDTKGGRCGLALVIGTRLQAGSVILLDDAIRPEEREIARAWETILGAHSEILGDNHPFIQLTVLSKQPLHRKTSQPPKLPNIPPATIDSVLPTSDNR